MPTESSERRGRLAGVLVGLAVLLAVLALVLSYAGRAALEAGPFADRVVATLKAPAVQDDVADHLTDAVVRHVGGDLVAVRPVVRAITGAIVGSGAFAALFRRAALELHASLVAGPPSTSIRAGRCARSGARPQRRLVVASGRSVRLLGQWTEQQHV